MLDLSIIVPMFNSAATIGHTLASLRGMKTTKWHCIVVNDGSTDNNAGADLVADIQRYDKRFTLITKPNGGLASARNFGLEHLRDNPQHRGHFVQFLDADDRIMPWNMDAMLADLPTDETSLCGHFRVVNSQYQLLRRIEMPPGGIGLEQMLNLQFVVPHCLVHRYEDVAPHRFTDSRRQVEDYDMWFRMALAGVRWTTFDAPLVDYRVSAASLSHDFTAFLHDGQTVISEAYAATRAAASGGNALAASVDASATREDIALGKQALTWSTRAAICTTLNPVESAAKAEALLLGAKGKVPDSEDFLAGCIDSALLLGLGLAADEDDPTIEQLGKYWHWIAAWCQRLISHGFFQERIITTLVPKLEALTIDRGQLAKLLLQEIISDRRTTDGSLTIFGFGTNGNALAGKARHMWHGPIRIRDHKLDPANPAHRAAVPMDFELEAWDAPLSPHTISIVSIASDAEVVTKAPLDTLDEDNLYRWTELDTGPSVWEAAVARVPAGAPRVEAVAETGQPAKLITAVMMLAVSNSTVGGTFTMAKRLIEGLNKPGTGIEFHLYLVPAASKLDTTDEMLERLGESPFIDYARTHGHAAEAVHQAAIIASTADVLLPGNDDLCLAACLAAAYTTQGRTKVLLTGATDDAYNRDIYRQFPHCDGGSGVTEACAQIVRDHAVSMGRLTATQALEQVPAIAFGVPVAPKPRKPTPGQLRIIVLGRIELEQKRIGDVLQVASALVASGANIRMDVVGDGPAMEWFAAEAAALKLPRSKFRIEGAKDSDWVQTNLRSYDVLLSTSSAEGLSVSLLEAMGHGVVPVATRISGTDGVVVHEQTGLLAEVGDVQGLTAAILRLCDDRPLVAKLAAAAHAIVREHYAVGASILKFAALIRAAHAAPAVMPSWTNAECLLRRYVVPGGHGMIDMCNGGVPQLLARDMAPTAYLASLLEPIIIAPPAPLANHPAVLAKQAIVVPGGLRPPTPKTLSAWRMKGHLPLVVHPMLDRCIPQRFNAALNRISNTLDASRNARLRLPKEVRNFAEAPASLHSVERLAIYGAGQHTTELFAQCGVDPSLVAVIDDRAGQPSCPNAVGELPVVTLEQAAAMNLDAVIVSSDLHEEVMMTKAETMLRQVPVFGIYTL